MTPAPYLLHVLSRPKTITPSLHKDFYVTEHLANLVSSNCATRATFYEEIPTPWISSPVPPSFLVLYQTPFRELMKCPHFPAVKWHSDLFLLETTSTHVTDASDFDARNYELIHEFDRSGVGEQASPQLLTVEMQPCDPEDCDRWYRDEHAELLSRMKGYRRCLRYKLGPPTELSGDDTRAGYLAVHEVDDVRGFASEEARVASETEWSRRCIGNSEILITRAWSLVGSEGY